MTFPSVGLLDATAAPGRAVDGIALRPRVLWALVILGTAAAAVVVYRLATMSLVLGSDEGRWTYVYLQGYQPRFAWVFARVVLICGALLLVPLPIVRRYEWWAVLAWLLVGLWAQGMMRHETRYSFEQIFVSDGANSFYQPTLRYDTMTLLRSFDRLRPALPTHARANMPGKIVLVSALEHLTSRPATLAWIVVSISNLGGVLLYLLVRDLFADQAVAYVSLILYLFVPAKLYFFPVLNTVTPVVILACAWLWLRALRGGQTAFAAGLGVALYGVAFFDPLALVLGLLFVAMVPLAAPSTDRWRVVLRLVGAAVIGFLVTHVAMKVWLDFDLLRTFRTVASEASAFNAEAGRSYAIWVRRNILDFLFGVGASQALLACIAIAAALYGAVAARRRDPLTLYCLAIGAVLLATDVIGVNRGEVVRLWIFLACLFQIPAAWLCATLKSRLAVMLVLGPTLAQGLLGTAMFNFAQP